MLSRRVRFAHPTWPVRLAAALLCLAFATALVVSETHAETRITWGGEWRGGVDFTYSDGPVTGRAHGELGISARTETYPWRAFFDGRLRIAGPITGDGPWEAQDRVDRLYLRLYLPRADVSLGKQFVNWGVGYAWDPTDVFNPPDPTDPLGERPGVLSAVVRIPVGPLDYWSLAAAEERLGVRRRGNIDGTDWAVVAVADRGDAVIGADFKGDLGVGWRLGAAYRIPQGSSGFASEEASWQALLGADYSWLNGKLVWLGEYFVERSKAAGTGRHTFQQLSYGVDEFTSVSASVLAELPAGQRVWSAALTTALGGESRLAVGLSLLDGAGLPASIPSPMTTLQMELSKAF